MWVKVRFMGVEMWAWKWTEDDTPSFTSGVLQEGQVWASIDPEGPYRPFNQLAE